MPASSTVTYTLSASITTDLSILSGTNYISNTVQIFVPSDIGNSTNNDEATDSDTIIETDPYIIKWSNRSQHLNGYPISYTIFVRNPGPQTVTDMEILDIPSSMLANIHYTSTASEGVSGNSLSGTDFISDTVTMPPNSYNYLRNGRNRKYDKYNPVVQYG